MATLHQILQEARKDAAVYYREFGAASSPQGLAWIKEAWADVRHDLKLSAKAAARFKHVYRNGLAEEMERLALADRDKRTRGASNGASGRP
jgi:hypothetical protein